MDDGCLSLGQMMAGRPNCQVVTLFAGEPPDAETVTTTYDVACGFRNARRAVFARRAEDYAALTSLHATGWHLTAVDDQYGIPCDEEWLAKEVGAVLDRVIDEGGERMLVGPLGLAHPDHVRTSRVMAEVLRARPDVQGYVYEELPARVLWPEQVPEAFARWGDMGWSAEPWFLGTGPLDAKQRAVKSYRSQMRALNELSRHAYLCPERTYRLERR